MNPRERLRELLISQALDYNPDGFVLRSGGKTDHLWKCNRVTLSGEGNLLVGQLFWEAMQNSPPSSVGGPVTGAISIAQAISRESNGLVRAFYVNKKPEPEPLHPWISGNLYPGDTVDIVEDVVTTGGSIQDVCLKRLDKSTSVRRILCIIDRREKPEDENKLLGFDFFALFQDKELVANKSK